MQLPNSKPFLYTVVYGSNCGAKKNIKTNLSMETIFELKKVANGNTGLFINGFFAGLFSEHFGISQFSGNKGQLFDVNLCVEYLKLKNPNTEVYSYVKNIGNQQHLRVSYNKFPIEEGTLTIH